MKNISFKEFMGHFCALILIIIAFIPLYIATNHKNEISPQFYEVATRTSTWLFPLIFGFVISVMTYVLRNELRK